MKEIKVGRSSGNDIVISDDGFVSGTHCQFIKDNNGNYWLIDMNSRNGTFVNGVRRSGKTKLSRNDIVRIGNTTLPWLNYFNGVSNGTTILGTQIDPMGGGWNQPVDAPKGNGFGIAALVCGIIGLFIGGIILGTLGIIFGGVSLGRHEKSRGLGITGLVLGIVDVVIAIIVLAFIGSLTLLSL